MSENILCVETDTGAYDIRADVLLIGSDLLVAISGGEKPHIGAVAVAQPRPSLKDPSRTSATASMICLPAHKEAELVIKAAETLAAGLNTSVVVTAGIHWDDLSLEGINKVIENTTLLVDRILKQATARWPDFSDSSPI